MNANAPLERLDAQRRAYESAWASLQRLERAQILGPLSFVGAGILGSISWFPKPLAFAGAFVGWLIGLVSHVSHSNFTCPRCSERFYRAGDRSIGFGFGPTRCAHCNLERDTAFVPEPGGYRLPGRWGA